MDDFKQAVKIVTFVTQTVRGTSVVYTEYPVTISRLGIMVRSAYCMFATMWHSHGRCMFTCLSNKTDQNSV